MDRKAITLRMTEEQYEALKRIANKKGISVNGLLNILINQMEE